MTIALSIYLDFVRFLAAIGVFLDHLSKTPLTDDVLSRKIDGFGGVCVIIFFVLSGFIIAYVTSARESAWFEYVISRVSRLYSVVIIGLVLTFLFDFSGMLIDPNLYSIKRILYKPVSFEGYISSLFFVNEFQIFGFGGISPGTNGPFWSLSFESTYYIVAGLILFLPYRLSIPFAILILYLAGETIAALLPVWFLGFVLYHKGGNFRLKTLAAICLFFISIVIIFFIPIYSYKFPNDNFGFNFPWGRGGFNRNLVIDYIVASVFSLHLIACMNLMHALPTLFIRLKSLIRWLGSITFPLYCIHYPALCFFRAVSPWSPSSLSNMLFISISTLIIVILITPGCEYLKYSIRNKLNLYRSAERGNI